MDALLHSFSELVADGIANALGMSREHGLVMSLHVLAMALLLWAIGYVWYRGVRDIFKRRHDVVPGSPQDLALHLRAARGNDGRLVAFEAPDGVWLYPRHDARGRPIKGDWEPAEDDEIDKALTPKPAINGVR